MQLWYGRCFFPGSSLPLKHTFKFSLALFISVCFIFQANIAKPLTETASDVTDTLSEYSEDLQQSDVFGHFASHPTPRLTSHLAPRLTPHLRKFFFGNVYNKDGIVLGFLGNCEEIVESEKTFKFPLKKPFKACNISSCAALSKDSQRILL